MLKKGLIFLIKIYQLLLSPLKGPTCRFYPSCSHYSMNAIDKYGALKGCWLTVKRLCKCHPFHKGGYDPVP